MTTLGWKEHFVRRCDGKGGYTCHEAKMNFLPRFEGRQVWPYSMAMMDNGEIIIIGAARPAESGPEQAAFSISSDLGASWSPWQPIQHCLCRCMNLVYLGNGKLSVFGAPADGTEPKRFFSYDYGRSWPDRVAMKNAPDGFKVNIEGNALADRDEDGNVTRIGEIGYTVSRGPWLEHPPMGYVRWSNDGGRTWPEISAPKEWLWIEEYQGQSFECSTDEGSLVRAANDWLVAGLRTKVPPECRGLPYMDDSLEGLAISISEDNGMTWSKPNQLFRAGRHHPQMIRMPNNDLVMTLIRRVDFRAGQLASYRRGCDAVVSKDNGLTWNAERMYVLDDFAYCNGDNWVNSKCGHQCSIALEDGSILTSYGNYFSGAVLINWWPEQ